MNEEENVLQSKKISMKEMLLMTIFGLSFLSQLILCFLYFNHLDFNWLVYLGGVILVFAVLLGWRARVAFEIIGASPEGESWLHTSRVVDTGIYGIVRHPMYLSFLLISLSLALLCQYWLNAMLGVIVMVILNSFMILEEKKKISHLMSFFMTNP
jgi:protein-S-isoprenylcysteine O-methyltransferase Ste14